MKIDNDKYYTPKDLAEYIVEKTFNIIGKENITEVIEPSAGNGIISDLIPNCIAYDIDPDNENIIKQDYLELNIPYKAGRLIIGNPPFGKANWLSVKFFKKSVTLADYIAFIQPISQFNCNDQLYEFDMIYSENLGDVLYSDRVLKSCFNIYKRPLSGLNSKPVYKIDGIEIYRYSRKKNDNKMPKQFYEEHDLVICKIGNSIGKVCSKNTYCGEFWIKINHKDKGKIIELIKQANWRQLFPKISVPYIAESDIIKYLWKEGIK